MCNGNNENADKRDVVFGITHTVCQEGHERIQEETKKFPVISMKRAVSEAVLVSRLLKTIDLDHHNLIPRANHSQGEKV